MALVGVPTDSPIVRPDRHITSVWLDWLGLLPIGQVIQDTRANRSTYPASSNKNRIYRETDTTLVYVSNGSSWIWMDGEYRRTQAQIAALVATLGVNDTGLVIDVTNFKHRLRWDGAALDFASGDDGSNYFIDAPSAPQGKTVQLCDGTATTYLKSDGTLGNYTTQNLTGHYRKSVTSGADALVAAVAPTFTGTSAVLTGSISAPVFTGNAATLTGSVGQPTFTGNLVTASATTGATHLVTSNTTGTGVAEQITPTGTVSQPTLTMNSYTPTGSNSVPTLTMNSYTPAGTISATAEPAAFKVLTYFRR